MWQKNVHYLDYNASAGISGAVRDQLIEYLKNEETGQANPSSRHRLGQREQRVLFESARKISRSFGENATPEELIFTSSGTEANQAIIHSFTQAVQGLIIGAAEHSASFDMIDRVSKHHPGIWVETLPLTSNGTHDLSALWELAGRASALGIQTLGISLFWANAETGVLARLEELRDLMKRMKLDLNLDALLHLDGAQVWGKISLNLHSTPADFVSFSSHKIGAPAGAGVIWRRPGAPFVSLFPGTQNSGQRGGSENVLGILGMGFACEHLDPLSFQKSTGACQRHFESSLLRRVPSASVWGSSENRVSNTSRIGFAGFRAYENWVEILDLRGFAVSHGSACRASVVEPSRVLLAMGVGREEALNSIRVSFGPESSIQEVDALLDALVEIHEQKKRGAG